MSHRRRVAIAVELDFALKRHHHIFAGVQQFAREHGGWECFTEVFPEEMPRRSRSRPAYDGIIARVTPGLAEYARRTGTPLVNVLVNSSITGFPLVAPDFEAVGRMAAEHLIARGFRQFGFVGSRQKAARMHVAGFRAALAEAGFSPSVLYTARGFSDTPRKWRRFSDQLEAWFDTWSLPIGVHTLYDLLCRYVASACRRRGIQMPQEAALIGTHNEPVICSYGEPALSSIELGYERVGLRAAETLEAMMDGKPAPTEPQYIQPVGVVGRESTDVLAVEDPLLAKALHYIAEHSHEPIKVGHVAAAVHTTRRTLERRFNEVLGHSPAQEIARLRVERAKRLLVESKASIKRLAADAGFRDATHLSVVFRRVTGINPSDYRRQRRGK